MQWAFEPNLLDILILLCLLAGMGLGFTRGFLYQTIGLGVLYLSTVLATSCYTPLAVRISWLMNIPQSIGDALAFLLILTVATEVLNWLIRDALRGIRLPILRTVDHLLGLMLGFLAACFWVSLGIMALNFALGPYWFRGREVQALLKETVRESKLAPLMLRSLLPAIVRLIKPWLPTGLPPIFVRGLLLEP